MQGQRSAIGSLPDSINFDYGSSSNNVAMDPQICWNNLRNPAESRLSDYRISSGNSDAYMGGVDPDGHNLRRWGIGESSSTNPRNQVTDVERMSQTGWSPSMNASSLRLGEQLDEPANLVSQTSINLNLSSNHISNTPVFVRNLNSGSASQSHDINEGQLHGVGDGMDCPNPSISHGGFESKLISSAGTSSSDPFGSSSESGGLLSEEDDGRPGCSLDGRRLSCKRKTLEGNVGQSSSSGGCFPRAVGEMWRTVSPQYDASNNNNANASFGTESSSVNNPHEQVNPRLGLGMGGGISSGNSFRPHGGPDSSHRNYRLRMNPSIPPDPLSNNSFLPVSATGGHPDIPAPHQGFRFVNPPLDLMPPTPPDNSSSIPQTQPVILRVPTLRRNMQAFRWNGGAPNLRPGSSSGERDSAVLPEDLNPRNAPRTIADQPMLVPPPPVEARSSVQNPSNWGLNTNSATATVGISRNLASSSRPHNTPGPSWGSHRHPPSQYSRRLSEYVRRSLMSSVGSEIAGHSNGNSNQHRSGPGSSQAGIHPPIGGGNEVHSQSPSRPALWLERQGDGVFGLPYSLRALAAAGEGRSRLVSEIRNALDMMRRGEGLRLEDVMILDQSVFVGMADMHDQHRDMRLDVDNMSYEELLALEERIGNVCTGLSEETILKHMKQRKYIHTMSDDHIDNEPCCICQEQYKDGDDLGSLDCGHDFHTNCIKQWLGQKNLCPICKTTGLPT